MGDGRILWLFTGGIYSFSAKLLELLVSHRHCETLGGSSTFSQKSNANMRGDSVLLGMELSITLHMGSRTKDWKWGSSLCRARESFLYFAQKACDLGAALLK